jgi:hypothetical protein
MSEMNMLVRSMKQGSVSRNIWTRQIIPTMQRTPMNRRTEEIRRTTAPVDNSFFSLIRHKQ